MVTVKLDNNEEYIDTEKLQVVTHDCNCVDIELLYAPESKRFFKFYPAGTKYSFNAIDELNYHNDVMDFILENETDGEVINDLITKYLPGFSLLKEVI